MNPESLWLSVGKGCSGFCFSSVWWNNQKDSKQHNEPQNLRALATLTFRKFAESFCEKHQGWGKTQIVCIWKDLVHSAAGRQISLRKPSSLSSSWPGMTSSDYRNNAPLSRYLSAQRPEPTAGRVGFCGLGMEETTQICVHICIYISILSFCCGIQALPWKETETINC